MTFDGIWNGSIHKYYSPVFISKKEQLFEIENAQLLIELLFYVAYKKHIPLRIKGKPLQN